jgi:uncharacterized protein (UPF0335 family)
MIDLGDVYSAAADLASGQAAPSVKLALWAGILSAQNGLRTNAEQVERLRKWARTGLPRDPNKVYARLAGTGNFTHVKCLGLYHVEALERHGLLAGLEHIGADWDAQDAWRKQVYTLMHGHGMGWKTITFTALILDPLHCDLCPIDRHVLHRLGFQCESVRSRKRYLAVERIVRLERENADCGRIPLGIWHWLKWEQWRQQTGASHADGCESHARLSCRIY